MQILIGLFVLIAAWWLVCVVGHGYANSVEHIAFILHMHAVSSRERAAKRAAIIAQRWTRHWEGVPDTAPEPLLEKQNLRLANDHKTVVS